MNIPRNITPKKRPPMRKNIFILPSHEIEFYLGLGLTGDVSETRGGYAEGEKTNSKKCSLDAAKRNPGFVGVTNIFPGLRCATSRLRLFMHDILCNLLRAANGNTIFKID
jgi:hypothetical protein